MNSKNKPAQPPSASPDRQEDNAVSPHSTTEGAEGKLRCESPAGSIYMSMEAMSLSSSETTGNPEGSIMGYEESVGNGESIGKRSPEGSMNEDRTESGGSKEDEEVRVARMETANDCFANAGFDDSDNEMDTPSRTGGRPSLLYMVSQVNEEYVIATKKSPRAKPNWPFFMSIEDKLAEAAREYRRKLEIGDFVEITSFTWNQKLRFLAEKRRDVNANKFWLNENTHFLPKQAEATGVAQLLYMDRGRKQVTGVIYWIKRKVQSLPSSFAHANVACCGLAMSARVIRRQFHGIKVEDLKQGSLVTVTIAVIPQDALVSINYVLPSSSPYRMGTERRAESPEFFGAIASIGPHTLEWPNLNENLTPKVYPCSAELTLEHVMAMEHVVGAALQIEMEREVDMMIEAWFEGTARSFDDDDCLIVFSPRPKKEVNELAKVWEPEAQVKFCSELGEKHFALGVIKDVEVVHAERERLELHIVIFMSNIQGRRDEDVVKKVEAFSKGGSVVIHPIPASSVEDRLHCFRLNLPSDIAQEDSPRGRIMAVLLGRPSEEGIKMREESVDDTSDVWREEEGPLHPVIRSLNARQRVTARLVLEGGLVQQQAPPGTGKTKVAAAIIKAMMDSNPERRVVVLACANIPVAKLVQEAESTCAANELEGRALALFSGFARSKYGEQVRDVETHTLRQKINSEEFRKQLSAQMMKEVKEYAIRCERNPRVLRERAVGKMFNSLMRPKIVFSTAAMAASLLHGEGNITDAGLLLFDESTQAQWAVVVHLVARMPNLEALLLTGDRHQLGVHLQELPELFRSGYGLESVIVQAEISPGSNYTFLTKMYRSHPFLAKLISYASYELYAERLIPSRSEEERALLTGSNFLLPVQECPVGLINAYSSFRVDPKSDSLTDDHQTEVAVFLVQALLNRFGEDFASRLIVLCMYTYQTSEIDQSEMGSGRTDNMRFFEDNQRATVALSRARHAVFIIGDLVAISTGPVWKRFIEMAITRTVVVRAEYVLALLGRTLERTPTSLFDSAKKESVEDDRFLEDWALKHGLRLDRTNYYKQQQRHSSQAVSFQFQPRHFPAPSSSARPDLSGPSGSSDQRRGAAVMAPQYGRGQGRRGPDGQWMNYGGNPKRQRGGRR